MDPHRATIKLPWHRIETSPHSTSTTASDFSIDLNKRLMAQMTLLAPDSRELSGYLPLGEELKLYSVSLAVNPH